MINYNFFGKDCIINRELSNRADLELKLADKGINHDCLLLLNQIHGREAVVIDDKDKIYGTQNLPKADAIVTNLSKVAIGVVTADCGAILFRDEEKNIIGAAHAGWRGAKLGVIKTSIEAMKNLGAKNIKAILGPMIQQDSYEVSKEFLDDFLSEDLANKIFFKNGANDDKFLFDLPAYIEKKLRNEGIVQIENLKIDTYKNEESFFSFRRSTHQGQKDCGRNVSVIMAD